MSECVLCVMYSDWCQELTRVLDAASEVRRLIGVCTDFVKATNLSIVYCSGITAESQLAANDARVFFSTDLILCLQAVEQHEKLKTRNSPLCRTLKHMLAPKQPSIRAHL